MIKGFTRFFVFLSFLMISVMGIGASAQAQAKKSIPKAAPSKAKPQPAPVTAPAFVPVEPRSGESDPQVLYVLYPGDKFPVFMDELLAQHPEVRMERITDMGDVYRIFVNSAEEARTLKTTLPDYAFFTRKQIINLCEGLGCQQDLSYIKE